MQIFKTILSSVLFLCFVFGEEQLKITLNSGEIINNCKFENLRGDTLDISLLTEENSEIIILAENIRSIVILDGSSINKYDFTTIPFREKISALNQIFTTIHSKGPAPAIPITSSHADKQFQLVLILVSIVLILVIVIGLFLKKRRKLTGEEKIPGAKEMVKTMLFWAQWHRDKR
jgi:hypothetical protein